MYGIEEKIINWLKGLKNQPVVKKDKVNVQKASSNLEEETSNNAPNETSESKTETTSESKAQSNGNTLTRDELIKNLTSYRNRLDGILDDTFLKKLEYTPKTDEEIEEEASSYAKNNYDISKNALDSNIQKKRNEAKENESEISSEATNKKDKLDNMYASLYKDVESEAIKRGISRSSIVAEQIKGLGAQKIQDYLQVDNDTAKSLEKNSNKLQEYEDDYNSAIANLELKKAVETKEKIDELTEKQNKKIEEVLKYNNTINEKLYNLQKAGVNLPDDETAARYKREMLSLATKYYYSFPREEAIKMFDSDKDIQKILGSVAGMVENYLKVKTADQK